MPFFQLYVDFRITSFDPRLIFCAKKNVRSMSSNPFNIDQKIYNLTDLIHILYSKNFIISQKYALFFLNRSEQSCRILFITVAAA